MSSLPPDSPLPGAKPYIGEGATTPYPRREVLRRLLWSLVQATLFRWSPRQLHGWRLMLLRFFGADIPDPSTVEIYPTAQVIFPWKLSLQGGVMVGPYVRLYNLAPISLRYGANISQYSHLCSGSHDFTRWSMPLVVAPIVVGENVWIAADVFVGPGVTIGELCVVGARSVVVQDLPPRMVCAGQPCRPIRPRSEPTR